jgi:hypothetical protein
MRAPAIIAIALLAAACGDGSNAVNTDHCANQDGDAWCAERYGDERSFCVLGSCGPTLDRDGCVSDLPADSACYSPCGQSMTVDEDASCLAGMTTGGETSSGSGESGTDTDGSGSGSSSDGETTGPMPCGGDEDCTDAAAPFCDPAGECVDCGALADGNTACAEADPGRPVCDAGECVACTEQDPGACGGQTPVCGEDNLCQACTEHSECPGTACHLDGAEVGACFDAAEVVPIGTPGALATAADGLADGESLVVVLAAGDYNQTVNVAAGAELAILGPAGAELTGTSGLPSLNVAGTAIVYVGGISIASGDDGVSCSGTSVWLDDSEVRNNAQAGMDISGGCAAHLRRTVVRANAGGGIDASGAVVDLRNSAIAGNGGMFSTLGGLAIADSEVSAAYTTIAGNDAQISTRISLYCTGVTTGSVANSILLGSGASIDGCGGLEFATNAVDIGGLPPGNDNVGPLDPGWFSSPGTGDFHLTTSGGTTFMDIASWQEGDPLFDIDGEPIPTDMPSFPGYDQP